jgi:hypothetical protein
VAVTKVRVFVGLGFRNPWISSLGTWIKSPAAGAVELDGLEGKSGCRVLKSGRSAAGSTLQVRDNYRVFTA